MGLGKPTILGNPHMSFQFVCYPLYEISKSLKVTPPKSNILHIIPWRFGSDHFPFQMGDL